MAIQLICLDADDTLWHNEPFFRAAAEQITGLLARFSDEASLKATLVAIEQRNLAIYGYGVKGFVLSILETAVEVAEDQLPPGIVREILALGRAMMQHPVDLIDGIEDALLALQSRGRLILVTKGDLFHQEAKLASSGLEPLFSGLEIVSSKTAADIDASSIGTVRSPAMPSWRAIRCGPMSFPRRRLAPTRHTSPIR